MTISKSRPCLHPNDKVYGILGMAPQAFRDCVTVDYDFSPRDVYKSASVAALGRDLILLGCPDGDRDPKLELLSWVLDFAISLHEFGNAIYLVQLKPIKENFRASLDSTISLEYPEPDEADTRAIILDVISIATPTPKIQLTTSLGSRTRSSLAFAG